MVKENEKRSVKVRTPILVISVLDVEKKISPSTVFMEKFDFPPPRLK